MIDLAKNLSKSFGNLKVLENFSLSVEKGKITCILGESGSGKSTLLNCIANLTDVDKGEVDKKVKCSYAFQKPNLFPNLTVKENLLLVNSDEKVVENALEFFSILDKKNSYPKHLSGGQLQRVSLARAFIFSHDIILLDEPFSSLDIGLKMNLIEKIKLMQKEKSDTILLVTHNISEAVTIADRIIILSKGKIVCDIDKINKNTEKKIFDILMGLGENT